MKKSLLLIAAMGLLSTSVLAKEIKFATEATYAPFEYLDDKNEFQGFDIDLAARSASRPSWSAASTTRPSTA